MRTWSEVRNFAS